MLLTLLEKTFAQFLNTFLHNWPYLLLGTLVAAALKLYVDADAVKAWVLRYRTASIFGATGVAVATPLCSCGSMAVILGMMASNMSWAPVVAFMVSSPLTSPTELVYSIGLFGWPLAVAFFAASILLGLAGGFIAKLLESRGWLDGQSRYRPIAGGSGEVIQDAGRLDAAAAGPTARPGLQAYLTEVWLAGRRLLLLFSVFVFLGYLLNNLMPSSWILGLFGAGNAFGVPLAATFGLPLYMNTEASLPLIRTFLDAGASPGAALAFMITGAGTSVGAIAGAITIARWRVVGLVIATLWVGAILSGYLFNLVV